MPIATRLDRVIDAAIAQNRIVGTSTLVLRGGEIIYARHAGWADREAEIPVNDQTIFRYASLTKPLIAALILAMVDKGLLSLHTPVTAYLSHFTPKLPGGDKPDVTLEHLLTHSAGLEPDIALSEAERADARYKAVNGSYRHLPLQTNMRRLAQRPLHFEPGTGFLYGITHDLFGCNCREGFGPAARTGDAGICLQTTRDE